MGPSLPFESVPRCIHFSRLIRSVEKSFRKDPHNSQDVVLSKLNLRNSPLELPYEKTVDKRTVYPGTLTYHSTVPTIE